LRFYSLIVNRAGLLLFGILVLPWHILVAWRDPDHFWFYIVDNQILRFLNLRAFIEDDVAISSFGFLAVTFIWFFPWGVFLAARPPKVSSNGNPLGWVMVIWALLIVGFFTLSRSRLEYYALPAFPALAVLVGGAWGSGRDIGRWLGIGWVGCMVVGLLAIWVGTGLTRDQAATGLAELNVYYRILRDQGLPFPFSSARPFSLLLQGLGVGLVVGWSLSAVFWFRRRRVTAFGVLLCLAGVIAGLILGLLRVIEPHHSAKAVSMAITSEANQGDLVVHEGSLEYSGSLPFYTGRRIVVLNGKRGDLDFSSRLPEAHGWFLDTQDLVEIWADSKRVFLVTQMPFQKSALSSIRASSIHQIGQYGSRHLYSNQPVERKTIANRSLKIG
jgi:4-amino-4-deoxy-L-arabinose transferase-like glycosyltransferase